MRGIVVISCVFLTDSNLRALKYLIARFFPVLEQKSFAPAYLPEMLVLGSCV